MWRNVSLCECVCVESLGVYTQGRHGRRPRRRRHRVSIFHAHFSFPSFLWILIGRKMASDSNFISNLTFRRILWASLVPPAFSASRSAIIPSFETEVNFQLMLARDSCNLYECEPENSSRAFDPICGLDERRERMNLFLNAVKKGGLGNPEWQTS